MPLVKDTGGDCSIYSFNQSVQQLNQTTIQLNNHSTNQLINKTKKEALMQQPPSFLY